MSLRNAVARRLSQFQLLGLGNGPPPVADPRRREARDADLSEVWCAVLSGVPVEVFDAAVDAYLRDPESCRWWPQPGQIRARAQEMAATPEERAIDTLDPDSAYAAVRVYREQRGPYWHASGPHLRDARRARGLSVEQVVERVNGLCATRGTPGWATPSELRQLEDGLRSPRSYQSQDLAEVYGRGPDGRTLAEELAAPDPWYDLETVAPMVALAARRATPWQSWTGLTPEDVPSHRKAFRDCFTAQRTERAKAEEHAAARSALTGGSARRLTDQASRPPAPPQGRGPARPALPDWLQEVDRRVAEGTYQLQGTPSVQRMLETLGQAQPSPAPTPAPVRLQAPPMSEDEKRRRLAAAFEEERRQQAARGGAS